MQKMGNIPVTLNPECNFVAMLENECIHDARTFHLLEDSIVVPRLLCSANGKWLLISP